MIMENVKWLKDCELCNAGVCKRIDELKEQGLTERAASRKMEEECGGEQSADKILGRYKYHAKQQYGGGGTPTKKTYDERMEAAINATTRYAGIEFMTVGCENHCDDVDGCRQRFLDMPQDEFTRTYEILVLYYSYLKDLGHLPPEEMSYVSDMKIENIRKKHGWYEEQ